MILFVVLHLSPANDTVAVPLIIRPVPELKNIQNQGGLILRYITGYSTYNHVYMYVCTYIGLHMYVCK